MSRRPRSELQFGSDSFLDVVANIVGILIILIVIAGLRVSQAPILPANDAPAFESPAAPSLIVHDDPPLDPLFVPEEDPDEPTSPAPLFAAMNPPRELPVWETPREWIDRAQSAAADIARHEQALRVATDQAASLRRRETELTERLRRLKDDIAVKERAAKKSAEEQERRRTSIAQLRGTIAQLRRQIAEEEQKTSPVETLEHRVTPISKVVDGHEQHYRLSGNRVSEVPVSALSFRLREQMERRKEWLLKQRSSQGQVGPIGGYTMHYVVQRDQLGVIDEVRYGQGMVRISVSNWRIEPEPDLETESAEEALRQGSRFYESLLTADEGTMLTFWVYPDSYALYRKLQRFAHEHGFLVAGRPLPFGVSISGSPNGSKSAGQ